MNYITINKEDTLYNSIKELIDNNKSNYIEIYDCFYITIDSKNYYYKNGDILQIDIELYNLIK